MGDLGSIPGLGRCPGEGKGYPLQYSGLHNSMDCIVHGVAKSQTQLSDFHFISISDSVKPWLAHPWTCWSACLEFNFSSILGDDWEYECQSMLIVSKTHLLVVWSWPSHFTVLLFICKLWIGEVSTYRVIERIKWANMIQNTTVLQYNRGIS